SAREVPSASEQRRREGAPLLRYRRAQVDADDLDGDVVRAATEVVVDALLDRGGVSPYGDGVDDRVAAAVRDVRVGPTKTAQVVRVVVQLEVPLHVSPRGRARDDRVGGEDRGLLDREERTGAELFARERGV